VLFRSLTAQAEGAAAQKGLVLEAEARGTQKLAEALATMTNSAKLILILDRLPVLMDKGGEAGAKIAKEIFTGCAAPLAGIKDLKIVDFGGNGNAVKGIGTLVPSMIAEIVTKLKATGVDISDIAAKCGIDLSKLSDVAREEPVEVTATVKTDETTEAKEVTLETNEIKPQTVKKTVIKGKEYHEDKDA
jgi:hypothetical protein